MYKRIVLKLSGEALAGDKEGVSFDDAVVSALVKQIRQVMEMGTQVCLVVGGGNFWRGRSADSAMDRTKADQIGMLATVMNAIYLADAFRQQGTKAVTGTSFLLHRHHYSAAWCGTGCRWSVLCKEYRWGI